MRVGTQGKLVQSQPNSPRRTRLVYARPSCLLATCATLSWDYVQCVHNNMQPAQIEPTHLRFGPLSVPSVSPA